ncbi:MAG: hypothetical protein F6K38_34105 [Moorea sp. SIO3B2]|nr:hypothetical protein [Moorena sp. SIO3B2]
MDYAQIAKIVVSWMGIPDGWVLSLDRTTWEFGSHCYNILTNGIVHEGVANPVLWWLLDKKGNSNSDERMRLPVAFYQLFPKAEISVFVCRPACLLVRHGFVICCAGPTLSFRILFLATDKIERSGTTLAAKVVFAHKHAR